MSSAMVTAQMPPAQGLAQSMMQRSVPVGAPAQGGMMAAQHPEIQDAAAKVRAHAQQLQAGGMPEAQARQQAITAFQGGQGQAALAARMMRPRPAGFVNPLNGMFGAQAATAAGPMMGTRAGPVGMPAAPGAMPTTRPGPQGFSNPLNGMFGQPATPNYTGMTQALGQGLQHLPSAGPSPAYPQGPMPPGRIPF